MKQYKVGDKVRVKTHERNVGVGAYVGGRMTKMCGKVCTISFVSYDTYQLKEDECGFYWCSDNFEPYVVPETKYKPGDVVTVRSDLVAYTTYAMEDQTNSMDATEQMVTKAGKKVKIKSVTKTGKYMIEGSIFPWVDGMFVDETKVEPKKTESKCKFQIGDKIIAKKNAPYGITTSGWTGEVVDVGEDGIIYVKGEFMTCCPVQDKYFDLIEEPKKWELVIRGEGDMTTAEYRCGDVTKKAEVNRFHKDQYSVHKAIEAVTQKILPEEKWVVGVKFDKGEKVYNYYATDNTIKAGDKVVVPVGKDNHHVAATVVDIKPESEVWVAVLPDNMKYVDRKCTEDDVITYYNGKVVCVYATPTSAYTVGKIYNIVDGQIRIYSGAYVPTTPAKTFKDFEELTHGIANFIEIVE